MPCEIVGLSICSGGIQTLKLILKSHNQLESFVVFFFSESLLSQVPNVTDVGLKPRQIKKVAIIGGGLMGSGIATALIVSNIFVVLKEVNSEYLLKGIKMIEGGYS